MNQNLYKLYQLLSFFVMKFSYKSAQVPNMKKEEMWLFNPTHRFYPIIRLTLNSIEQVDFEATRIDETVALINKRFKTNGRFLDIHIGHDTILEKERYDSVALDIDYYDGIELSDYYPGLKNVLHPVSDPNLEIREIISEINGYTIKAKTQRRNLKEKRPYVTYATLIICVLMYLVSYYLSQNYGEVNTYIFLGANYEMFTVGLWQFWRLVTAAFLHGGIMHLLMNMLSLYVMGPYLERELGSLKFGIMLYGSVILASLTSILFGGNGVSVGLSGGLYGLMAIYLLIGYKNHTLNNYATMQIVLINVLINFLGGVDVYAHIGGFIAGVILYYAMFENPLFTALFSFILVIFIAKVYMTDLIEPKYGGTDTKVIAMYRDFGMNGYADFLEERLYDVYQNK